MNRSGSGTLAVIALVLAVVAWVIGARWMEHRDHGVEPAAAVPAPPPREVALDTLGSGESLAEMLAKHGFTPAEIHEISQAVRDHKRPRTLRPGMVMRLSSVPGEPPDRIHLQLNPDTLLHMTATDSGWVTRVEEVPVTVDTLRLAGVIESSLWFARLSGDVDRLADGEFKELVYDLADVFAWKVDFTRDIRKGDAFRVAIRRELRPDGSARDRRFLAIEFRNAGKVMPAVPYERPDGRRAYFDTDGQALRGVFLRYPVPYRITSGFTNRRYHPVLKRVRRHQGIDYGAPYGAGVQATASGTVTRAGWWGDYGRAVEIRHTGGIRTRYAHLSSIPHSIRTGARVEQGQIIGRVGATGLATGTHLHYEFIRNGVHRNPLSVSLPSAPALEDEYMADFRQSRDRAMALLDGVTLPGLATEVVAATESGNR